MRALCWNGVRKLAVERVPDPEIVDAGDIIVRVKLSAVCGSDLHLVNGYIPTMRKGDILGHEFMGEVVEVGSEVKARQRGERVVVVSPIACGACSFCADGLWSLCDNAVPDSTLQEKAFGYPTCGIYGHSHACGGFAGSHAEYVRVPFADFGAFTVPEGVSDEAAVFVSDACPTGYMAAEMCAPKPGDVIAVWGCGGVGQMAIRAARLLGAERVIAIDRLPERLRLAEHGGAETIDYSRYDVYEALLELTAGRGPDACIDAVGMEAHGFGLEYAYDRAKHAMHAAERGIVVREAIRACRKGGTISIVGVYGSFVDKFPLGAAMNKGLTLRMGQQHGQKYATRLLQHIAAGELDAACILTHRLGLDDAPRGYDLFQHKKDGCVRAVFAP